MTIDLTEELKKVLNSDDLFSVMQDILLREQKVDQDADIIIKIIRKKQRFYENN